MKDFFKKLKEKNVLKTQMALVGAVLADEGQRMVFTPPLRMDDTERWENAIQLVDVWRSDAQPYNQGC